MLIDRFERLGFASKLAIGNGSTALNGDRG
jgi:hypothetical protein